ncbi:hypothetical protein QZH41_007248 [Actinostola sp. cb2023]|nr:hypothetical protein QZH41_007248 [Actinostola sp. cb2023]
MRPMESVHVLSAIQELPESGFYSAVSSKRSSFFPKKKLSRLHGLNPRTSNKHSFILPPSMFAEKLPENNRNEFKKRKFVIPKIIVEEVHFEDDLVYDPLEQRSELCRGFLHPSYAIYAAVSANDSSSLKNIILSGRVNVNRLNASGVTALHEASYEGKSRCVEILVQCGADVDIRDREGWTPLHAAVCGGNRQCVAFLLKSGANIRSKNDDGLSPLGVAVQQGNKEMAEFLSSLRSSCQSQRQSLTCGRV